MIITARSLLVIWLILFGLFLIITGARAEIDVNSFVGTIVHLRGHALLIKSVQAEGTEGDYTVVVHVQ
jgi:hypothetical protein